LVLRDIVTFNQPERRGYARKTCRPYAWRYFRTRHFAPRLLSDIWRRWGCDLVGRRARCWISGENFVAFFAKPSLLQYDRPVWRTVKGGSQRYVAKLTAPFATTFKLGCAGDVGRADAHGVVVHDSHGNRNAYDHVVIARTASNAAMLADADEHERSILGAIGYSPTRLSASRSRIDAKNAARLGSWNFLRWQREASACNDVSVTYWMNPLQGISDDKPLFVSLNRRSSRSGPHLRQIHGRASAI